MKYRDKSQVVEKGPLTAESDLGDLWDGNVQIDIDTEEPIIFDSCAFYGHNESQHAFGNP